MSETPMPEAPRDDLLVKRILNAPLEMVWAAWTEPEHIMRWWGPKYYTSPSATVDLREGGHFLFAMQGPPEQGGMVSYTGGIYTKIVPMELLEFTQFLADDQGNAIDPASIGMPPDFPAEIESSVTFKAIGALTELTIVEYDWPVSQMFVYSLAGMHQTIDKMADALAAGK